MFVTGAIPAALVFGWVIAALVSGAVIYGLGQLLLTLAAILLETWSESGQ